MMKKIAHQRLTKLYIEKQIMKKIAHQNLTLANDERKPHETSHT